MSGVGVNFVVVGFMTDFLSSKSTSLMGDQELIYGLRPQTSIDRRPDIFVKAFWKIAHKIKIKSTSYG